MVVYAWRERIRHLNARKRHAGVCAKQAVRLRVLLGAGLRLLRVATSSHFFRTVPCVDCQISHLTQQQNSVNRLSELHSNRHISTAWHCDHPTHYVIFWFWLKGLI